MSTSRVTRLVTTSRFPRPTLRPAVPSSAKVAMCCGRCALSTAPTASGACACRCTAAGSCALPVVPGATWTRRGRSGVRSSSARRPSGGLQPAGSARPRQSPAATAAFQAASGSRQDALRRIPQHRVCLPQPAGPRPTARRVPGRPAGEPWRGVPAAAGHSPGPGAAVWRGLCGAGHLAACRPRLAGRPRGLSAYHAGRSPGEPVRACGWHCGASAQSQAARSPSWRERIFQRYGAAGGCRAAVGVRGGL